MNPASLFFPLSTLVAIVLFISPSWALAPRVAGPGTTNIAEKVAASSGNVAVKKAGVRFVFESPNPGFREFFIPVSDQDCESITPLTGLPTLRIPFPKGGKLALFSEKPVKNKKKAPEAWGNIPSNITRLLCLVTGNKGNFKMMFFNEEELPNNSVLILNRTSRPYLLVLNSPPPGEKNQILIPGGGQYTLKNAGSNSSSQERSANLMVEYALKNGQKRWLKDRSFTIPSYPKGSQILLFAPNEDASAMLFQKILLPRT